MLVSEVAAEAAATEVAAEGNFFYRGLAQGEDVANGLTARAPNAGNSPMSHAAGKRASQWISTTKSEAIAIERYGQNGVVRIDLNQVTSPIVDLSGGFGGNATMLSRWAINSQEVLISTMCACKRNYQNTLIYEYETRTVD